MILDAKLHQEYANHVTLHNHSTAKVETSTQDEVETVTPAPTPNANNNNNNNNNNNGKNKITKFTTTTTTQTLYFAGYTSTITTTNSLGEVTTFATYIPPSTVLVVKKVAVTAPALEDGTDTSDSMTILHGVNNNSLWGVTMSLAVVTATLVFMIFA
ncbi:hypothetical protein RirG_032830 [Rhizophagus irregularis DAOM 197198w]|uniref:Uncharacterized protein n=1 Tax=Rhizophagus irregularis (strain DAOM 197198w) TaxID=1432141 RepID=A0A015LUU2_RHIIW|nr:hypothetical protein RirG_032830 [Rhizophagus irregularis DAOM 197198w]